VTETNVAQAAKLYDEDFYLWTRNQADALRRLAVERWNGPLDLEHLAEEVEGLGKSELSTVRSQVRRLLEHLLKLEHSPAAEPRRAWIASVLDARDQLGDHLTTSIHNELKAELGKLYRQARRRAAVGLSEYGEGEQTELPAACPYRLDQVLDEDWFPANQHGLVDRHT
jgi:DNA-binding PucR family transcriptional regulator